MGLLGCKRRNADELPAAKGEKAPPSGPLEAPDNSPGNSGGGLWQAAQVDSAPDLRFAFALFGAAAGTGDSDYVCSPWSVASALAALGPGTTAEGRGGVGGGQRRWRPRRPPGGQPPLGRRGPHPQPIVPRRAGAVAGSRRARRPDQP